jgi:thiol-disulfide isomerase/thioredoxin
MKQRASSARPFLRAMAVLLAAGSAAAADVPTLKPTGQADYREYQEALDHRAFAIAPGGAWGWKFGMPTRQAAEEGAMRECRMNTRQKCLLYDSDGRVVFDAKTWATAWRPYLGATEARKASQGREIGQRLPDLAYTDAAGRSSSLSAQRGKVVIVHLWASWCGPCRREMPELQKLHESLAGADDVVFVPLQLRESHATATKWAQAQGFQLPYADSGSSGTDDAFLRLKNGDKLPDRIVAPGFPTTHVLDRNGIVVFTHVGDMHGWPHYRELLLDVARHTGR